MDSVEHDHGKKRVLVEELRETVRRVLTDPSIADNAARTGKKCEHMEVPLKQFTSSSNSVRGVIEGIKWFWLTFGDGEWLQTRPEALGQKNRWTKEKSRFGRGEGWVGSIEASPNVSQTH